VGAVHGSVKHVTPANRSYRSLAVQPGEWDKANRKAREITRSHHTTDIQKV